MTGDDLLLDTGDKALRFAGTVELWKNILGSLVVCIGCGVGIYYLLQYHSDFAHGAFKVDSIHCDPPATHTDCANGRCTTKTTTHCPNIRLHGFPQPFVAEFTLPAKPPDVGATMKAYYDPADRSKTAFLAQNDFVDAHKPWILAALGAVCLSSAFWGWFQFHVRKSHLAQRVAGAGGVLGLAMR